MRADPACGAPSSDASSPVRAGPSSPRANGARRRMRADVAGSAWSGSRRSRRSRRRRRTKPGPGWARMMVLGAGVLVAPAFSGSASAAAVRSGLLHQNGPPAGSGRGFGRGPIGDNRCYQVCPPVVYPTGHDPYYDSAFFTYEKELHGGPFGPGTLNPFNPNNPMNFAGHWPGVKQPIMPRSLPQAMPVNYYPGMGAATTFLQTSAYAGVRNRARQLGGELQRSQAHAQTHVGGRVQSGAGNRAHSRVHPKGVMCLHVCPKFKAARPDDEPMGGPFGPDPYYFRGKTMFNNKNGHTGFGSSASNFRNYQNEAYGGPFGPDPYYVSELALRYWTIRRPPTIASPPLCCDLTCPFFLLHILLHGPFLTL